MIWINLQLDWSLQIDANSCKSEFHPTILAFFKSNTQNSSSVLRVNSYPPIFDIKNFPFLPSRDDVFSYKESPTLGRSKKDRIEATGFKLEDCRVEEEKV